MKDILVIGSLNADLVVRVPRFPSAGETLSGSDLSIFPGGKGANQAVAAARMGAPVCMAGRIGADSFGPMLIEALKAAQVDTSNIQTSPDAATGTAVIAVETNGENRIILSPGANAKVSNADVNLALQENAAPGILILQFEIPMPAVYYAAARAKSLGWTVILNPAPAVELPPNLLSHIDFFVPNGTELSLLTGCDTSGLDGVEDGSRGLLQRGAGTVIVTLGANGALLVATTETTHIAAFPIQPVDTTAAGDAFIGALAASLAQDLPLPEAVRRSSAAGALAALKPGAQPSLPSAQEVDEFLKAH